MNHNRLEPKLLTIDELFGDSGASYTVPIYQRNYTWQAEQIEQLLSDIQDAIHYKKDSYFLGNLVVTTRQTEATTFEVIDGQQRLTTLYLLLAFLTDSKDHVLQDRLSYESRPRAAEALRRISNESLHQSISSNTEDSGIRQGYNLIGQFMEKHIKKEGNERDEFKRFLCERVNLVRVSLPSTTDFNRYFEIMNTRGQQLQQPDIVKARLMRQLGDAAQQACFAWIWEACSDMDSYVQMSLTRGDTALRQRIFGDDWSLLKLTSFHDLVAIRKPSKTTTEEGLIPSTPLTLDSALAKYAGIGAQQGDEDHDNVRFRSIIEFPAFLLHALKVMDRDSNEDEAILDDKVLVKRFTSILDRQADKARWVQDFSYKLLRCRNLFDSYVLKRQYTATNSDEGDWSLQRLIKRPSKGQPTPGYRNTFSRGTDEVEEDGDIDKETKELLMLQSMLRVTYTSPQTMHWITQLLKLLDESDLDKLTERDLADSLRKYARGKVKEAFFTGEKPVGFGINRIVFTYLDYLLWERERNEGNQGTQKFRFSFRNSIEHFYPQHPDEQQSGKKVSEDWLHHLGNLALVSVGANSKFSNSTPSVKAGNFGGTIERQSIKLRLMAEATRKKSQWGDEEVEAHHNEMIELLERDVNSISAAAD